MTKSLNSDSRGTHADALGGLELLVLLAVRADSGNAYGRTLQLELAIKAGRQLSLGTICKTLHRLEARGLTRSRLGGWRPMAGGRRKKLYAITAVGAAAATRTLTAIQRLASSKPG